MENYVSIFGHEFNIDPVAFTLGSKEIYWYGVIIALALISGYIMGTWAAKRDSVNSDTTLDIIMIGAPSAIIGARLYYVIFSFSQYKDNLWRIFAIWEGGLAIYGGIIGAAIAVYIYTRIKKLDWKMVFDFGVIGIITGQCIGRWGNFINKEAYGAITNLPWKMGIYENFELIYVHPTFLYESLWNFVGIFILFFINKRKQFYGQTFYSYLVWYGIGRFMIEGLRTDSLYFGPFRISQMLAITTAIIGIILIFLNLKKQKNVEQ